MSDLISREQALDCFHCWVDKYGDVHEPDEIAAYRAIEALPSVNAEPRWIPIEEQSPKDDQWCVIIYKFCDGHHYMCVGVYKVIPYNEGHEGMWRVSNNCGDRNFITTGVIAWMPLPEPYCMNADREEGK